MRRLTPWAAFLVLALHAPAWATGMLIPAEPNLPPLAIKHQRVSIEIRDQVAATKIEQVFQNNLPRDLEATYIFPLPANASIQDFAMYIGGKRMSGELVEKDKARQVYEDIVRRMKDPGILEYLGNNLFRIRVYPVPRMGTQKIELAYSEVLRMEGGVCRYVYPLKTPGHAAQTLEDFSVRLGLESRTPIKTVYSPTHNVGVTRKSERSAVVGFEQNRSILNRDFILYYTISEKDFGINLLTHRVAGDDGYFMLMISPSAEAAREQSLPKDVCFVVDTSGSMADNDKIEQARKALLYCVKNLNPQDSFNIIRFSTDVDALASACLPSTRENIEKAAAFIGDLRASGGTNIHDALAAALSATNRENRPYSIVFLTDGQPTVGNTDIGAIVANVRNANPRRARVFVFGVGYDVNTHLLDQIAEASGGDPAYVRPDENIEMSVSAFSDKVKFPVLSNPRLDFGKIEVRDAYPNRLPDIFKGSQLVLFGRYRSSGPSAIRLAGEIAGSRREVVYEGVFGETNPDNAFIKQLWATRKVGYLLDEIRLHGENPELKNEVIRLSKAYNIQTPYTSYLVLEDDAAYAQHGVPREGGKGASALPAAPVAQPRAAEAMKAALGKDAFDMAGNIARFKQESVATEQEARGTGAVRHVGSRAFVLWNGVWTETSVKQGMETIKIKYAGAAYFKLLDAKPEWKEIFLLGDKVAFVVGNKCLAIGDEGAEDLAAEQISELTR